MSPTPLPAATRSLVGRAGGLWTRNRAAPSILRICIRTERRSYHSHDHPSSPRAPIADVEDAILAAAYKHVPDHGFSQRALSLGARDAGYLDVSSGVFADGPFSLIRYHLVTRRQGLAARSRALFDLESKQDHQQQQQQQQQQHSVDHKVAALTLARLMENKHIIHQWQDALALMAQPSYLPESLKELAALSDEILFLAGDESVDPSWYTKRAALSMIYTSSELFMTNDRSPNFDETKGFLQRRLQEAQFMGGTMSSLGQFAGFSINAGINVLRSKGFPI